MGPFKKPSSQAGNQVHGRRKQKRRPRTRRCLLKGCERRFRPRQAPQRYCSQECRKAAREWSRWKAQERYRATKAGQQKRNQQSQRYRKRVRDRKQQPTKKADPDTARVIPTSFFRRLLRPARLLRGVRPPASIAVAKILFAPVPACDGTGLGARAALAEDAAEDTRWMTNLIRIY